MALGAVLGAALNTAAVRKWGLFLDGLDVSAVPGTTGNSYGVAVDSITVTEAGSGNVSTMSFVITDPRAEVSVSEGQLVRFQDFVHDMPNFLGWTEDYEVERFGVGRLITVRCVGIEALLDWAYVPVAVTIPVGTEYHAAQCAIIAASEGLSYPVNLTYVSGSQGPQASPFRGPFSGNTLANHTVGPGSVRDCLYTFWDLANNASAAGGGGYGSDTRWFLTVDFWGGVRANWQTIDVVTGMTTIRPPDYVGLTLDTGGAIRPSMTKYGVTSAAVAGVYVAGSGAGARYVGRGGPAPGPVAVTGTTGITTSDGAVFAANSYFARRGVSRHGTVVVEGGASVGSSAAEVRAGSPLTVIDPQAGLSSPGFKTVIAQIDKVWAPSGEETWTITFGGYESRSGTGLMRALTKAQRV